MNFHKDYHLGIVIAFVTGVAAMAAILAVAECEPMSSKAASWMNSVASEEQGGSYSHLGGGSKFTKAAFIPQLPRAEYQEKSSIFSAGGNTSNRTLAAILVLTVIGLLATAMLVLLCSKMGEREKYDSVKGTIY